MTLTTPALAAPTASSRAEHSGPTAGTHGVPNHPIPTRLGEPLNPHQEATPMSLHYYATPTAACPSCDSMATLDALGIKFGVRQQTSSTSSPTTSSERSVTSPPSTSSTAAQSSCASPPTY